MRQNEHRVQWRSYLLIYCIQKKVEVWGPPWGLQRVQGRALVGAKGAKPPISSWISMTDSPPDFKPDHDLILYLG
uniref:Uncharacterized protein n=1 Tax=Magallana gigas TaxID=29159 RepID=K1QIE3_MAGGI